MRFSVQRLWFYFRMGYGSYVAQVVSIIQFLLIAALYTQRVPQLAGIHLTILAVIFVVPLTILSIVMGLFHTRHQMNTDFALSALRNPYLYRIMPGKEAEIQIPFTLTTIQLFKVVMVKWGITDPVIMTRLAELEAKVEKLTRGEEIR